MEFAKLPIYRGDWGQITVEGYNEQLNEVSFIFNYNLLSNQSNVINYVIGRLCWGIINFPANTEIRMIFDIRGQNVIISKSSEFKQVLTEKIDSLNIPNKITIEFFR